MDGTDKTDDGDQVGTGNDGAFEVGPGSPFNPDGSPRLSAVAADQRWAAQVIPLEQAGVAKKREAEMAVWFPNGPEGASDE